MISTMRPDIDHADEYGRNTAVASALGIPSLLPFLKAICRGKKSWQAGHIGVRIIQRIAIMMGCAVLPHLRNFVDCIAHGLFDEQQKVKTMSALAIAILADCRTLWYRVLRQCPETPLGGYPRPPRKVSRGVPESHPAHGPGIRLLLY